MKRTLGFLLSFICMNMVFGQRPPLDFNALENWPSAEGATICNNGEFLFFFLRNIPVGHRTMVVESTHTKWKREFPSVDRASFTDDNRRIVFELPGDSLCILELNSEKKTYFPHVRLYRLLKRGWLACMESGSDGRLTLHSLHGGASISLTDVDNYVFDHDEDLMAVQRHGKNEVSLELVNLVKNSRQKIWQGGDVGGEDFSNDDSGFCFVSKDGKGDSARNSLWVYKMGDSAARLLVDNQTAGIDSGFGVMNSSPSFDYSGNRIFFRLNLRPAPIIKHAGTMVDIWDYRQVYFPAGQRNRSFFYRLQGCLALVVIGDGHEPERVRRLENGKECVLGDLDFHQFKGNYVVLNNRDTDTWEYIYKNRNYRPALYRLSLIDGSKIPIPVHTASAKQMNINYFFSPTGRWLLYYNEHRDEYYSYEFETGITRNITIGLQDTFANGIYSELNYHRSEAPAGIGEWTNGDSSVLIYGDYDIWKIDPSLLHNPVDLTNGYGKATKNRLRLIIPDGGGNALSFDDGLLLTAFNAYTKYNGFYKIRMDKVANPELLTMGPYSYYYRTFQISSNSHRFSFIPSRAKDVNVWIVGRATTDEAPNFFITRDFKQFKAVSDFQPQRSYTWLRAELVRWKMFSGDSSQGILYTPEDLDSARKYPIIFLFYTRSSDCMYDFPVPSLTTGSINPAYYVSRGYAVFLPDIYYRIGHVGEDVVNSVASAALYLSHTKPWINEKKMGINGESFGGYEVLYLFTHTHIFAAAAECCGMTDLVSDYGGVNGEIGSEKHYYEDSSEYYKMGGTMWEHRERYIENSPIFEADNVTTPLLILHNPKDPAVVFPQGLELFTALWQLDKPVWLLEYDGEGHGVWPRDQKDFDLRMRQFFDYYLKDALPPKWMTEGIPGDLKGVDAGLELDNSGKKP